MFNLLAEASVGDLSAAAQTLFVVVAFVFVAGTTYAQLKEMRVKVGKLEEKQSDTDKGQAAVTLLTTNLAQHRVELNAHNARLQEAETKLNTQGTALEVMRTEMQHIGRSVDTVNQKLDETIELLHGNLAGRPGRTVPNRGSGPSKQ